MTLKSDILGIMLTQFFKNPTCPSSGINAEYGEFEFTSMYSPIRSPWNLIFSVEWLICLGTALYQALAPTNYMQSALQISLPPSDMAKISVAVVDGATSIFDFLVIFYGFLLFNSPKNREERTRTFKAFQTAMLVGDIIIVTYSPLHWIRNGMILDTTFWARVLMAAGWGLTRAVYLFQH
eukprot:TRINITY_DN15011_c0_g1_i3.p1 TRINITY_DN15011_c0_g1~~TRINITY_DN15011_c0_g1_i3.p1  ORF type:complete len:180 (+),score=13.45 TRINITY_DN15011_c0_g1_i3:43-582(+)